ncbi:hypothetical protein SMU58_04464 [Streptococcus mutans A19]|nr:hypothetical protein SMU58_04464 [Streptococcus mutans A19]EMC51574.1 hypothetical protein SMU102_02681 [Streptococcus mutans S1B]
MVIGLEFISSITKYQVFKMLKPLRNLQNCQDLNLAIKVREERQLPKKARKVITMFLIG